jgi:hypothetical protein
MVEFIGHLFDADKALKVSEKTMSSYYTALTEKINAVIDSQIQLNILNGTWTEKQAQDFRDGRELNKKIIEDNKWLKENLTANAKEMGLELADIYNEKTKTLTFLSEGEIMTEQLRRSKDIFEEIKKNKERNKILRQIYSQYSKQVEEDRKLFSNNIKATELKVEIEKNKELKKLRDAEHKRRLKEQDDNAIAEMERRQKMREKGEEIMRKYNDGQLNEKTGDDTIWWDKENGITLEDHNQTLKDIEAAKKKAKQDKEDEASEAIKFAQRVTQIYQQELNRRFSLEQQQLDRQIQQRERNIDRQVELAKSGLDNTLAYEQMARAKAELERRQSEEREARRKEAALLAEAYMNALNARLKEPNANASEAPLKAAKDVLLAKAIAKTLSSFFDGTEDTGDGGNVDNKKGFLSVLHPNERVMTAEQNKKTEKNGKKLANETLADIAYKYNTGQLMEITPTYKMERKSTAENIANSLLVSELRENNKYLKMIADKPAQVVDVDKLGNVYEKIYTGSTIKTIIHKPKTRI